MRLDFIRLYFLIMKNSKNVHKNFCYFMDKYGRRPRRNHSDPIKLGKQRLLKQCRSPLSDDLIENLPVVKIRDERNAIKRNPDRYVRTILELWIREGAKMDNEDNLRRSVIGEGISQPRPVDERVASVVRHGNGMWGGHSLPRYKRNSWAFVRQLLHSNPIKEPIVKSTFTYLPAPPENTMLAFTKERPSLLESMLGQESGTFSFERQDELKAPVFCSFPDEDLEDLLEMFDEGTPQHREIKARLDYLAALAVAKAEGRVSHPSEGSTYF
jgi:hypothetical protein